MSSSPKAVFLSYASQDAEAARGICDALRAVSVEVWFDQSALRGGDAWDASIRRQIKECALFVLEQDPLRPAAHSNLANALRLVGRFAEAEAANRKVLELAPQRAGPHGRLSLTLLAQDRGAEALAEALREPEEWMRLWALAIIHHAEGHRAESDTALEALIAQYQDGAACQVAQVYAARSELELAFQWLERAYDQRDPGVGEMKSDPLLRSLHVDPRWEAFLRKMGLAE